MKIHLIHRLSTKIYFKFCLAILIVAIAAPTISTIIVQLTRAAEPWYVGPGGSDGNACTSPATRCATINGALNKAGFVAGDTIFVQVGTYTGSGDEVVLLDKDVTLSGGWNSNFSTQNGISTIDAQGARRGIKVNNGVMATVERFAVQNGYVYSSGSKGGGIYIGLGTVTLNNSIVSGNFAGESGGGIFNELGTMILNNSTISNNTAGDGGGICNIGTTGIKGALTLNNSSISGNTAESNGGGICNNGTLTLNNTIVASNTASSGGGISNSFVGTVTLNDSTIDSNNSSSGGGISSSSIMTITNSIVSGNTADARGGGIKICSGGRVTLNTTIIKSNTAGYDGGGGIHNSQDLTLNNSTVSNNVSTSFGGGISTNGTLIVNNSTVSNNTALNGGGIAKLSGTGTLNSSTISSNVATSSGSIYDGGGILNYGPITLQNSILAGNTNTNRPDCSGTLTSLGYNIIGNTSGCTFNQTTDLTNIDPKLGPLIGSPGYHPLLTGSPAIDAGNPTGCTDHLGNPLDTDQRHAPRVGRCDIGAYEFGSFAGDVIQTFLPIVLKN